MVEQVIRNDQVVGSIPISGSQFIYQSWLNASFFVTYHFNR